MFELSILPIDAIFDFSTKMLAFLAGLAALIFVGFLTGTIIVETVFVWPGLGLLATTAVSENDFPVMTGSVLLFAVFYTVIIFLSDFRFLNKSEYCSKLNSKNKIDFFELFGLNQRLLPFPTNDSNVPLIFLYVLLKLEILKI